MLPMAKAVGSMIPLSDSGGQFGLPTFGSSVVQSNMNGLSPVYPLRRFSQGACEVLGPSSSPDAEFAAKAVNAHAALVASIKNLVMLCEGEGVWAGHEQARAALKLAGEEMP